MGIDTQEAVEQGSKKPAREVVAIEMTDGRTVEFAGKRKMLKTTRAEHGKASVIFDFRNGETRTFHVPHEMIAQFAAHGAAQKIGDEASGEEDVDDMVLAVDNMIGRLEKGEWKVARATTGDSFRGANIVVKAICEVTGQSVEKVKEFLEAKLASTEGLTRQKLYSSFRNPSSKTGQVIARLEQEKASKSEQIHADDLLADLA